MATVPVFASTVGMQAAVALVTRPPTTIPAVPDVDETATPPVAEVTPVEVTVGRLGTAEVTVATVKVPVTPATVTEEPTMMLVMLATPDTVVEPSAVFATAPVVVTLVKGW
jgi:hypothetical protein